MKYQHALCLYPYYKEPFSRLDFFPPAGIEHIAAALEGYVGAITFVDLRREQAYHELSQLLQFIRRAAVDLICVSVNWPFYVDQVCNLLNALPAEIPFVVGGQYATTHVAELFRRCPQITLIVRGEGEETIRELAQGTPLEAILGISYRRHGEIVHNPNRPLSSIEMIRYPNRHLRRRPYDIKIQGLKLVEFDTVFSSRGCPARCKFCTLATNPLGQKRPYAARSPESVAAEIEGLTAQVIYFSDDNFLVMPERIERLCDLLLERNIRKIFIAQARIDLAQYPARLLKKLEKAGFKAFLIGVESPHDRILQTFEKGFTSQEVRAAFRILRDYAFFYDCFFIYGNLGESRAEMLAIPKFAKEIGADAIWVQDLQARAFSPMLEVIAQTPGYHLTPDGFVYSDTYSLAELNRIGRGIRRRFYTPDQVCKILRKLHRIRVLSLLKPWLIGSLLLRLPVFLYRGMITHLKKKLGGQQKGIPYA